MPDWKMRIHLCIAILQGVVRGAVSAVALGILIKFIHDYCGGAGHALYGIVVLLLYFWISDTERKLVGRSDIDINKIKTRLKDSSNNLSKKVRTKKKIFTEELPGLYYCQIGAFITIILWIIYGIYSLIHGLKSYIVIEIILAIITAVMLGILLMVTGHYEGTVYRDLYSGWTGNDWTPFGHTGEKFSCGLTYRKKITIEEMEASCIQNGYVLFCQKKLDKHLDIWIYKKAEKNKLWIFEIVKVPGIADEDIDKLNEDFHEMLKLDKIREKYKKINLIYILYSKEETPTFRNTLHRYIKKPLGNNYYRLSTGYLEEEQELYRSISETFSIGDTREREYKRLCKEFYQIMQIAEKDIV